MRISSIGNDAGMDRTSALNQDANLFHVSALSPDAGLFHVSAIGSFLSANQQISAILLGGTANIGDVSAIVSNSLSATAQNFSVSAVAGDAGTFRVSAILAAGVSSVGAASFGVSAAQIDAGVLHVSGFTATATNFPVSAVQADAGLQHTSGFAGDANQFHTSTVQGDAGLQHTSGYSGDASQLHTSSIQGDAGLQHVSAMVFGNTTGGLTISRNINVSTSNNAKATAGAVYGWHAWNTDLKPNYIRLMNTSGAINTGTDVPILNIVLTASSRSDAFFPMGLKGFTNGIGLYSTSAIPDNSTTGGAASATGIDLFYI